MSLSSKCISVLIVDDHAVVREGLAAILQSQQTITVVGQAEDGHRAVEMYRRYRPDVCLMDLAMPRMDGASAIVAIRAEDPHAKIIVLTTYEGDEDIYRALRAGAKGYLLKDTTAERLLNAIRTVSSGGRDLPPEVAQKMAERIPVDQLSDRENDVLHLLVQGKSNQEIGDELGISEGTVKSHMNRILAKLGVGDRTQAVIVALRRGLAKL